MLLTRPARRLPAALPACLQYVVGMVGNYAEQLQAAKFCLAPYLALLLRGGYCMFRSILPLVWSHVAFSATGVFPFFYCIAATRHPRVQENGWNAVEFKNVHDCWARDIATVNADNGILLNSGC